MGWLAYLTPFFTYQERHQKGCQHRLFFAHVEYCNNLIFRREEVLGALRSQIFGRRIRRRCNGNLQTTIQDLDLGHPSTKEGSARESDRAQARRGFDVRKISVDSAFARQRIDQVAGMAGV